MALLPIHTYPDPVLKQTAERVTIFDDKLAKLLEDMAETMYKSDGVGLAANQVGILKRVVVVDVSRTGTEKLFLINPEIIEKSGSVSSEEGCLSVPEYRDTLKRSENIKVKAQNLKGQPFELEAEGILAICLQHELDHLDGVLFVDRLSRLKRELFKRSRKKMAQQEGKTAEA